MCKSTREPQAVGRPESVPGEEELLAGYIELRTTTKIESIPQGIILAIVSHNSWSSQTSSTQVIACPIQPWLSTLSTRSPIEPLDIKPSTYDHRR